MKHWLLELSALLSYPEILSLAVRLLRGERVELPFRGNSMSPSLETGDVVVLRCARVDDFRVGALAATIHDRELVLHRITAVTADCRGELLLTLRGDNLPRADTFPVPSSRVLGIGEVLRQQLHLGKEKAIGWRVSRAIREACSWAGRFAARISH